jgi:hypothetical protein
VTQGRLENFMPPFGDSLTVAERWNAVAYLYTISVPPEQLAAGQAVYSANCAGCHGEQGQGAGPDLAAGQAPPDLRDHEFAASRSPERYFAVLSSNDPVHAFAGALSEADRWAAVDYARTLAYDYSPPETVLAEGQGTVRGELINGTAGAEPPTGLPVTLYGFEGETLITTLTTTVNAEGAFAFDAVDFAPGRQFVAATHYQGITYSSEPASFVPGAGAGAEPPVLELPLPVYETTTDTSVLSVAQVHMFLEFNSPQTVTVGELVVFANDSDKTFAASAADALHFSLPAGATDLNVQGGELGETYFPNEQGFGLVWSVPPGQSSSQVLYSYRLPYDGALSFAQPVDYPIGSVNVLVSDLGVAVAGSNLQSLGLQEVQGQQFQSFSLSGLAPGESLAFEVSGQLDPSAGGPVPVSPSPLADTRGLAIGLAALAAALLGIGYWLFRRRRSATAPRTREDLLQALASLDDDFAAGGVDEAEYHKERAKLKEALKAMWRES